MKGSNIRLVALGGVLSVAIAGALTVGSVARAHHAVASVYDLNTEVVLEGRLTNLNFRNPHSNLHLEVPNDDGSTTEWVLTTASVQTLTRAGVDRDTIQVGESLRITVLPARNGNPAGFIRRLELGDRDISLAIE